MREFPLLPACKDRGNQFRQSELRCHVHIPRSAVRTSVHGRVADQGLHSRAQLLQRESVEADPHDPVASWHAGMGCGRLSCDPGSIGAALHRQPRCQDVYV